MDRGLFVSRKEAEKTTLSEALDRYAQEVSSNKKGAYQESRRIECLKRHKLAKRYLASIQGKDIAEYRDERLKSVSQAAVRLELALLSHLFNTAIREWGMSGIRNPIAQIRLPKNLLAGIGASSQKKKGSFPHVTNTGEIFLMCSDWLYSRE